jgi:KTSC domain
MKREPMSSGAIKSAGYDPDKKLLEIEFNSGGIYQYEPVPQDVANAFHAAQSKGRFFREVIQSKYPSKRIAA